MEKLIDGKEYWLGAVWGVYKQNTDVFIVGNTWVERWKTIYKDQNVRYNEYGFIY